MQAKTANETQEVAKVRNTLRMSGGGGLSEGRTSWQSGATGGKGQFVAMPKPWDAGVRRLPGSNDWQPDLEKDPNEEKNPWARVFRTGPS